jgi:branched-chain amino acid transport system substrate-binding protein
MKHRTTIFAATLVILLALSVGAGVAACGSDDSGGGGSGGGVSEIKIGTLYPVSGDLAKLGDQCISGVKMAVEEINAAGGIKSMGGAKLVLVEADSQGKPDVGISEITRLCQQDNVTAILGTYQSSVALPATQTAERFQTPMMITTAVADEITQKGYKYIFRICDLASWYARDQILFCKAMETMGGPKVETVALLHEDTDFGQSTSEGQLKYAAENGIKVVANVAYAASSADLTTQVSKVKAANPDVVLTTTYLNDSILIAQEAKTLGMKQLFFDAAGGTVDPQFIKTLGDTAENWLTEIEFSTDANQTSIDLNADYKAKYGDNMTGNGMDGYQGVYVLAKALEDAGTTDKAKLRDAIANVKLVAGTDRVVIPTKEITFSADGEITDAPLYVVQIQKGVFQTLYPLPAPGKLIVP